MHYKYHVEVLELKEVHELPDAWTNDQFKALLEHLEYEDMNEISADELKEMTGMALSDFEPEEAAEKVLEFRFGDQLNEGQRENIAPDFRGDKLWEEYSHIKFHEELFNVACMLHWAFPLKFPEPDIVRIKLKLKSLNPGSAGNLEQPTASFIARMLTDGMDEHNTIYRLFDDNIAGNEFLEAEDIIWKFDATPYNTSDHTSEFTIYTSWNWVDELKGVESFESTAYSDGQRE